MKEYLTQLPREVQQLIGLIKETAQSSGFRVYLIGGFVRDLLLGVTNLDLDIAVLGDGIAFAEILAGKLHAKLISHRRFGTATLTFKPHHKIDISSTRKEVYPHPGSLPVVSSGTLEDDLARRDFTINALAISITGEEFGRLKDICKGTQDLLDKKIRVLHELSFIDDPTRILRAIRFQKRYDFSLETKTRALLKEALQQKMLERVQPQRLRDEILLMLNEKAPLRLMKRLDELGGLGCISKGIRLTATVCRLFKDIDAQIHWFRQEHHHRRHLDGWLVYFLALIDSLDTRQVRQLCAWFVFKKGEEKRILDFKKLGTRFVRTLSDERIPVSKVFTLCEHVSYEALILLKAKYRQRFLRRNIEHFLHIQEYARTGLCGHDLQEMGVSPGPCYQTIFRKLLHARLDGKIKTKEEELVVAKKIAASLASGSAKSRIHQKRTPGRGDHAKTR